MANNKKKIESALTSTPKTDVKLSREQIEEMLAHVIRLPTLFTIAKSQMPAKTFPEREEAPYHKLWVAAMAVESKQHSSFFHHPEVSRNAMWSYIQPRLANDPEVSAALKDYLLNPNTGLLAKIYNRTQFFEEAAYQLLKRFMRERLVQAPLAKKLAMAGGNLLDDLPQMLHEAQQLDTSIDSLDKDPVESGAPEGWEPVKLNKYPTGVKFIDNMLRGGHAGGEVYGILGAFGSGKTSLAVQLLYNSALYQQNDAKKRNDLASVPGAPDEGVTYYPKECYIFSYEATKDEIRMRLWSSSCNIEHGILEEFDRSKLSSNKNGYNSLKDYEKELYKETAKAGHQDLILGELERLESTVPMLRRNLWVLDMSGTDDNPKRGTGYVPEIRQIIDADLERKSRKSGRKHEVGLVVVDYAGLVAWRHIGEHSIEATELRHYIGRFGDACKKQLAVPLGCPIWIFHQLTGEANKRTHKVQQHYTDAAESKGFAENLAFCFALGTKDEETNTLLFSCSKARRAQIGHPPTLVLEGDFFRLAESKEFTFDTKLRTFVRKSNLQGADAALVENMSAKVQPKTSPFGTKLNPLTEDGDAPKT
jgi:hypothetical protein